MGKFTTAYNNFSGGQVSEKFKGRFDTQAYQNALEEMDNLLPSKIGGAFKRTGSLVIADLSNVSSSIDENYSMIPFDPGDGDSFIILLPNTTIRMGYTTANIYIYRNDGSYYGSEIVYDLTGGAVREYVPFPSWVPKVSALTGSWKYCQVGDIMFITHSSGLQKPLAIARTGDATFDISYYTEFQTESENLAITLRPPYSKPNISSTSMSVTGTTLTSSAAFFTADMVGSLVRIDVGGISKVVVLQTYLTTTTFTVTFELGAAPIASSDDWRITMWNNEYGFPTSVAFFGQRLVWGGTPLKNQDTVWITLVGNLFHLMADRFGQDSTTDSSGVNYFGAAVLAKDPLMFPVGSQETNAIKWIRGDRVIMVGTSGGEQLIKGVNTDNLDVGQNSSYGSSNSQVVKSGKDVIFIGANRKTLHTYRYSRENGSWLSDDLTSKSDTLFESITEGSDLFIEQISWNSEHKHLWVLLSDNRVLLLGLDSEYGISAWTTITMGGSANDIVLGVTNVQNADSTLVETFLMVKRFMPKAFNGYLITLEKITGNYLNSSLHPTLASNVVFNYPRFVDMAFYGKADAAGLLESQPYELEDLVLDCLWFTDTAFGYELAVTMVLDSGGTFTKPDFVFAANARVIYGYKYNAHFKTLPPEAGGQYGTSLADIKTIHESYLKLYRTKDFSIGSIDSRSGLELPFEDFTYSDLETTNQRVQVMDNPDTDGQIIVRSTTPTPFNVLAIISKGVAYD